MNVDRVLDGTPYSLPEEAGSEIARMQERLSTARSRLLVALKKAERIGLVREMDRANAYWTVYESNRIEFEGPDLGGTVEAIESTRGQDILRDLNITLLPELLRQDREAFAAVGLETARVLALRFIGTEQRGVRQTDIRSLHSIVMAGSYFGGRYRDMNVEIQDQEHEPFPPINIWQEMHRYAEWSQRPVELDDAILRAAIGHAWFTHIHPFYDGNGRVGRLLTNVFLGQDQLPPAIVKAKSQRTRYIAALAHSDEGGDIMPLVGLFLETIERYVGDLQDAKTFKRLFDQLVQRRGDSFFDWYQNCMHDFLSRLQSELSLSGLQWIQLDELTREVFVELQRGGRQNVMAGLVTDKRRGYEIALYYRTPHPDARSRYKRSELVPALALALPNERYRMNPYRRASRQALGGLGEFWVQPDGPVKVFVDDLLGLRSFSVNSGASFVVERLSQAFVGMPTDQQPRFMSAAWLPKINGGPG